MKNKLTLKELCDISKNKIITGGKEQQKAGWDNFKFMATNLEFLLLTEIPIYL